MKSCVEFSIIVTVYNIEDYIGECLDSILSQTYTDFEIICVDDCSTDNSPEIVSNYAKNDKRIVYVKTTENSGLASARNLGIKKAKGKFLYNIDGDDLMAPGALQIMHKYMEEEQLDMLSFSALSFFDDIEFEKFGSRTEYIRKKEYPGVWVGKELFAKLYKNNERVNGNMVLYCFNREFIIENELFLPDGLRYCDDRMFSNFICAQKVICINEPLYYRRYRSGSVVTSAMKKIYLESLIICYIYELIRWKRVCSDIDEFTNSQIEMYFDDRAVEISEFEELFIDDNSKMNLLDRYPMESYIYYRMRGKKSIYSKLIKKKDMDRIIKARNIYVYGAGNVAKKVADILKAEGKDEFSFVVTNLKDNIDEYLGKKVLAIDEISTDETPLFIIAVSSRYQVEILENLKKKGFYDCCLVVEG